MDIIKMQETPKGTLVMVDCNEGDFGHFYRQMWRRVALIKKGTSYYQINGKNVIRNFGANGFNHYSQKEKICAGHHADERFEMALRKLA